MQIPKPNEFLLYYAIVTVIAIALIVRRRRPRGMRLKLEGETPRDPASLKGAMPPGSTEPRYPAEAQPSTESGQAATARVSTERSLNVHFNYNGHSWDAYEVLGLPAGSGPERVRQARDENLARVDPTSKAFIEAAYRAISAQWN